MKNNGKPMHFTKRTRLLSGLLLAITIVMGTIMSSPMNAEAAAKKPYLIESHMLLIDKKVTSGATTIGATKNLTVQPGSGFIKSVEVKSSNEKVATVKLSSKTIIDITGESEGKATITVDVKTYQTVDGKADYKTYKLEYEITVYDSSPFSKYVYNDGDRVCFKYTGTGDSRIIVPEGVTKVFVFVDTDASPFSFNYDITYIYLPKTIEVICMANLFCEAEEDTNFYNVLYQCPNLQTVEGGNYSYQCNGSTVTRPGDITVWSNSKRYKYDKQQYSDYNSSKNVKKDTEKNAETDSETDSEKDAGEDSSSKQTIYVLSGIVESYNSGRTTITRSFSYNSKGLITTEDWLDSCQIKYTYRKDNQLKKAAVSLPNYPDNDVYDYSYYKNGRRSKVTFSRGGKVSSIYKYTYDSKGRLKKAGEFKFIYSGQKIKKVSSYNGKYETVQYDDNGNIKGKTYTNNYEDGRLIKRSYDNGDEYLYTYKKIVVDKKFADLIKQQQWSLLNFDLDRYFYISIGWG